MTILKLRLIQNCKSLLLFLKGSDYSEPFLFPHDRSVFNLNWNSKRHKKLYMGVNEEIQIDYICTKFEERCW